MLIICFCAFLFCCLHNWTIGTSEDKWKETQGSKFIIVFICILVLQGILHQILFVSRKMWYLFLMLVCLTHLTQSPFGLCNHTATNPEKLLSESGDGCFLPKFWRAHNGVGGWIQGVWALLGLAEAAFSHWGGKHPWWNRSQRLKGGRPRWHGGQWWTAAQPLRLWCHCWADVPLWTFHLAPALLSHPHYVSPTSASLRWAPQGRFTTLASVLACPSVAIKVFTHQNFILRVRSLSFGVQSSNEVALGSSLHFAVLTAGSQWGRAQLVWLTKSSSSCNPTVSLQPCFHGGIFYAAASKPLRRKTGIERVNYWFYYKCGSYNPYKVIRGKLNFNKLSHEGRFKVEHKVVNVLKVSKHWNLSPSRVHRKYIFHIKNLHKCFKTVGRK